MPTQHGLASDPDSRKSMSPTYYACLPYLYSHMCVAADRFALAHLLYSCAGHRRWSMHWYYRVSVRPYTLYPVSPIRDDDDGVVLGRENFYPAGIRHKGGAAVLGRYSALHI